LIDWLKDEENLASLTDAVNTKKLYKADAVRRTLSRCLVLDGCEAYQHGKSVIAGVQDVTFTLNIGGDDADTYSACLLDVSYQLEHHLLHPPANSPPLIDPRPNCQPASKSSHAAPALRRGARGQGEPGRRRVQREGRNGVQKLQRAEAHLDAGRRRRAVKARRKRGRGAVTPAGHGGGPGRVREAPNGGGSPRAARPARDRAPRPRARAAARWRWRRRPKKSSGITVFGQNLKTMYIHRRVIKALRCRITPCFS
jgi:hypothetical protein